LSPVSKRPAIAHRQSLTRNQFEAVGLCAPFPSGGFRHLSPKASEILAKPDPLFLCGYRAIIPDIRERLFILWRGNLRERISARQAETTAGSAASSKNHRKLN
jgi:hypothetical protein